MEDNSDQDKKHDTDTGPQGTRVLRRENLEQRLAEHSASQGPMDTASGAALIGAQGAFKGKRYPVPSGRSTLGRDNQNDMVINDDSVSLVHARLIEKDGHYRVLNLLSTNGTWVNDKKVSDSPLRDGDAVCFGEAEFIFQQSKPPASGSGGWLKTLRRWLGL
jgi:hypothetical protein